MTIKSTSDNLQTPLSQITSNIEDPLVLRRHLLSYVLYLAAGIGAVLLFMNLPTLIQTQQWVPIAIFSTAYLILLGNHFLLSERSYNLRVTVFSFPPFFDGINQPFSIRSGG